MRISTVLLGVALVSPACAKKSDMGAPHSELSAKADGMGAPTAGVQAGEWDDNANYRDYLGWIGHGQVARLDPSGRQFLVVEDRHDKAMPNCTIDVRDHEHVARLTTTASGRALLFPKALGLSGDKLTATATCGDITTTAQLDGDHTDGVFRMHVDVDRSLPARRTVDLAFVLDTTGSMSEEIAAVQSTIASVATKLDHDQVSFRVGLVAYKDRSDEHVTEVFPFSTDTQAFAQSVSHLTASGGGDYPEDMHAGLATALDQLNWQDTSTARMVFVIADAPPHLDYSDERDYAGSARVAASKGIKLYTVSASGMDATGQLVMRQMAQFTGATNMFVLRGGAGPQSTGGGDPMSSCGGTHQDYASGKLDELILGKVKSELASVDADPMRIAGVGQDENAKPCDQRIVMAR